MREPYRTLFAGYEDHWLLGQYLWGDEPDWPGLLRDERTTGLSQGEKVLLDIACWFAGPWHILDDDHRRRVALAAAIMTDQLAL